MRDLRNAEWRKSSYSGDEGGNCVEVAANVAGVVGVRDSKVPGGAALAVAPEAWAAFVGGVKSGALAG
ncbi:hypothetical protein Sru01_25580 [Sphaerisporangium rufum]|uniref:DUF397 domain-containing protein n=1 Tax=Sphaerisporangium rufum TaxID=1381558 RepID=A0A919UY14_9ACTN|nr:DUF397 domain-containing protein [Sphaerisporangium rufum]GII77576.1 hypothetical protein Sru01_25580 [Sphaerisporangium rufum]